MSDRFVNYPCSFNSAGLIFTQLGGVAIDFNQSMNIYTPDGAVDQAAAILNSASPMARINTRDLTTVFGSVSPTVGLNCTGASLFRLQQRAAGAIFAASTAHVTLSAALGLLTPQSVSAAGDQPAELSLNFCGLSATGLGADPVFVPANSVDFTSAPTPAHNSTFYLGAAYLNGTAMPSLISASVDFGLSVSPYLPDGKVYPTECSIVARRPSFTLTFNKMPMIFTLTPTIFNTALSGTFALYFRKGSPSASRVTEAATSNAKFSCSTGAHAPVSVEAAGETDGTISWRVYPTSVISAGVASAIP